MLDLNRNPFVIISSSTEKQSAVESFKQSYSLREYLINNMISFKIVSVQLDDISFLIPGISESHALAIAGIWNQKCVLVVDHNREAQLIYTDGSYKQLGYFMQGESKNNFIICDEIKYICSGVK